MVGGKHSHQMLLSSAMAQVASQDAHSEQVDEEVKDEGKGVGRIWVVGVVVVGFVEERVGLNDHHCHQDQHLTKETLVT